LALSFMPYASLRDHPGVWSGAPHDLTIPRFDNQHASSAQANASKIRVNARKR
jgi:hypothetical protein